MACKLRHSETGAWFIRSNAFSEWKASEARSALLLVYGIRPLMPSSYASAETKFFPFL
jgi:hypothetical protein